jgi:serine/threonine protein kinase
MSESNDDTRVRPKAGTAANDSADATRVRPPPSARDSDAASPVHADGSSGTGSNWSHPERWSEQRRAPIEIGSVIRDRFELESVLGEGGMGVVYRALDRLQLEMKDRDPYVAIKILSEEFRRHPNALIALQREARKAQTLAHPNIITVYNFDRDGATVYMTMELLDGETLRSLIAARALDGGLPASEVVPMIRGMAEALAYAHKNEIVHSDFKPGNVFLTRKGMIKVLDFGVARAAPANVQGGGDRTLFDVAELGALTPAYASPEMLKGKEPTYADDVFALGIVACELLTGRHPFDRGQADAEGLKRLTSLELPGLTRRQRNALIRALSAERSERQADAGQFLKEFEGPSALRSALQLGLPAAAIAAATVAVIVWLQAAQPQPDVPFESLPPELQRQFEAAIAEGETATGFGQAGLNDAWQYFTRAYQIHRNNPLAIDGLEAVADAFLASLPDADPATQRGIFELLYCQEYVSGYAPVTAACVDVFGSPQCEVIADDCSESMPAR